MFSLFSVNSNPPMSRQVYYNIKLNSIRNTFKNQNQSIGDVYKSSIQPKLAAIKKQLITLQKSNSNLKPLFHELSTELESLHIQLYAGLKGSEVNLARAWVIAEKTQQLLEIVLHPKTSRKYMNSLSEAFEDFKNFSQDVSLNLGTGRTLQAIAAYALVFFLIALPGLIATFYLATFLTPALPLASKVFAILCNAFMFSALVKVLGDDLIHKTEEEMKATNRIIEILAPHINDTIASCSAEPEEPAPLREKPADLKHRTTLKKLFSGYTLKQLTPKEESYEKDLAFLISAKRETAQTEIDIEVGNEELAKNLRDLEQTFYKCR